MVGGLYGYFATKTGHPDITEILIKVALNTTNQIKSNLTRTPLNKGYLVVKLKSSRHQVESITVATMTCLAITEYLCHKWARICAILSSWQTRSFLIHLGQSIVLCVVFYLENSHWNVCPLIYGFWLPIMYLPILKISCGSYHDFLDRVLLLTRKLLSQGGCRGRDPMLVGFTTTYAISAYHHWCCEFESR